MTISDKLYKQIEITNPIIEQLVNTKPFLRLKEINQYGGVKVVYPDKYQVSRYQHSLGVYHVLYTLGANLETQVAGLLHDIGHTALSHMYDMALSTHTEDNHEQIMHNLEGWEEIQKILAENNLKIGHPDNYILLKKSLPDIGADRFDYALRDYFFATNAFTDLPIRLLEDVETDEEGMYFKTTDSAVSFAETGNKAMWHVIYEPSVAIVYQSLIEMIRLGLEQNWLSTQDFMQTDKHVIEKMQQNKATIPEKYISVLNREFTVEESPKDKCDFEFIKLKSRYFDPRVKTENGFARASELNAEFKASLNDYIKLFARAKTGIYYKVEFS